MTAEQFAYWFQGFAELSPTPPTQAQWDSMREHVATVFKKVTPPVNITIGPGEPVITHPNIADAIRSGMSARSRPIRSMSLESPADMRVWEG